MSRSSLPASVLRIVVALWLGFVWAGTSHAAEPAPKGKPALRAGAAVVDITPAKLPVSMVGSFAERQATSVHDPLNVRCLVLDDGTTRLALLTADTCLISRETFDEAKRRAAAKTGIPAKNMLMSATHTHSGATAMDLGNFKADEVYVELLTSRLADAVEQATAKLEPAEVGFGSAPLASEVHNRRWKMKPGTPLKPRPAGLGERDAHLDQVLTNPGAGNPNVDEPAGPTDPDVMVLGVRTAAGKPLAVYAVYSLHYVGGIPPNALSADYFGEFAKQLAEKLVTDENGRRSFTAILSNGTSGDINNVDVRAKPAKREPMEQVRLVAGRTADVAAGVYRGLRFRSDLPLGSTERELMLGVRKPSKGDVGLAEQFVGLFRASAPIAERKAAMERDALYLGETIKLDAFPDEMPVKLQVLRVGGLAIAAIPCEPFAEVGLEIKRRNVLDPTFVVGLANGYHGYLPTPDQHRLGGYETWRSRWSYLEVDASTKIVGVIEELINAGIPRRNE